MEYIKGLKMRFCFFLILCVLSFPALADVANSPDPIDVSVCSLILTIFFIFFIFNLVNILLLLFCYKNKINKKKLMICFFIISIISIALFFASVVLCTLASYDVENSDSRCPICRTAEYKWDSEEANKACVTCLENITIH
jgi:uncharacterized membrane-anchored protein YitT (DUF2179 family)